jgi:1,4-dihydroxy-2-naphthoyl-CoA hydrolase
LDGGVAERNFQDVLGMEFVEASGDRVVVACKVTREMHQPYGILHGGVYCSIVESAASIAGALWLGDDGNVVGVSNHTNFIRATRDGTITGTATPLQRGRTQQLWQVEIVDEQGRLCAHGQVRLANLRNADGLGRS